MVAKELPKRSDLVDFPYAVAGHAGTLCDVDGSLFIKPCTQSEIDFYEAAQADHRDFASLMPLFLGKLMLSEASAVADISNHLPNIAGALAPELKQALTAMAPQPSPDTPSTPAAPADNDTWVPRGNQSITTDRAIVLENATYGYKKPNVLDVKLGQRLWADNAPTQKRIRMDEVRATTTHHKLGFRIAGMRVYKGSDDASELDESGYRSYDKDYGRYDVNDDNVVDAFRKFIFNEKAGIDPETSRTIAQAFKTDLERVCAVMEKSRTRMYSSSLLFVFEGDGPVLRATLDDISASVSATASANASRSRSRRVACTSQDGKPCDRSTSRTDSGIVIEDDEIDVGIEVDTEVDLEDEEEEEDDGFPNIYGLHLIDFAHARFCRDEDGPDENSLIGVRSLIRIFDELAK